MRLLGNVRCWPFSDLVQFPLLRRCWVISEHRGLMSTRRIRHDSTDRTSCLMLVQADDDVHEATVHRAARRV